MSNSAKDSTDLRTKYVKQCFDVSDQLRINNKYYRQFALTFFDDLLIFDTSGKDVSLQPAKYYQREATAIIKAKAPAILAGMAEIRAFLDQHNLRSTSNFKDGDPVKGGETILTIKGQADQILMIERTVLNIFQRLSGIATVTAEYSKVLEGLPCFVTATRKTLWGIVDKSALQYGGGLTHRLGLADVAILKENHLAVLKKSGDPQALMTALNAIITADPLLRFVEVEVTNDEEFWQVVEAYLNLTVETFCVIMFDHFTPENIERLIAETKNEGIYPAMFFEASGDITLETIRDYAASGVDVISVGALTHSVKSADFSLLIDKF
ncbi:MAG TPA: carboxylating nicotinate-nucleotide diphosphorylase [Candidatus Marinimicrobia bacterium]|nr:carboxylating nicotinate-nucleotide diphosphorylase [Candidatus Neomarinimicrobiota bacterium]HRS51410.1 carboxylating nicotinate-nucleotide diphosphorylase [Candidatus Neomarinimicrobiota bacterium]HRU92218.1 carboxylating nicotinate-nucleotide diphosphorylase [Candidatus Neomarinimicrobiota bacterium]